MRKGRALLRDIKLTEEEKKRARTAAESKLGRELNKAAEEAYRLFEYWRGKRKPGPSSKIRVGQVTFLKTPEGLEIVTAPEKLYSMLDKLEKREEQGIKKVRKREMEDQKREELEVKKARKQEREEQLKKQSRKARKQPLTPLQYEQNRLKIREGGLPKATLKERNAARMDYIANQLSRGESIESIVAQIGPISSVDRKKLKKMGFDVE